MTDLEFKLLDSIAVPVSVLERGSDNQPRYVAFNQVGCDIGQFKLSDVLGKTAREAFAGPKGESLFRLHVRAFDSTAPITEEFPLLLNDRERRIRTVLSPVVDAAGAVVRVVGSPLDVTSEHALNAVKARTKAVNKEMEEFISLAAHDLRSPMRNIPAISAMLREDMPDLSPDQTKLLDMLESVASKSFEMISDLLSHTLAADLASERVVSEVFNLKEICRHVLTTLDPLGSTEWQASETQISGEPIVAQTIIRNLLDNAIKHNSEKIGVSISAAQVDDKHFEIVVADSGVGFTAAGQAHLLTGRITTDSGFGLAGVRRLIASRGGSISVDEAVPGDGATIRVRLPGAVLGGNA